MALRNYASVTGLDLDESAEVAAWLAEDGVDFGHLSLWDHRQPARKYPDESPFDRVRRAVPAAIPIVAAGQFWTPDEVTRWSSSTPGAASPVALGRSAILNPDWPLHAAEPGWEPRRPPLSVAELGELAVSPAFANYLRRWKGFVRDAE